MSTPETNASASTTIFPVNFTGTVDIPAGQTITTATDVWAESVPSEPTEEFLKSWKWLRIILLKQLLSDNPQGIIEFRIDQKHTPTTMTEYEVTIKFIPMKSKSKLRELSKPEL